jgi:hypothetical protein
VSDPQIIVFALPLRDPLPIASKSTFTRDFGSLNFPALDSWEIRPTEDLSPLPTQGDAIRFVSLRFWQLSSNAEDETKSLLDDAMKVLTVAGLRSDHLDSDDPPFSHEESYRTIVEAVTIVLPGEDPSDALTLCVSALCDQIRAYRVASKARISELTYERICPIIPYFQRTLTNTLSSSGPSLLLLAHANVTTPAPDFMGESEMAAVMQSLSRLSMRDPLIIYAERRLEAEISLFRDGQYAEAAIQAAIAAEVLLTAILSLILWEEGLAGKPRQEAMQILGMDLSRRVRASFHPRIGGIWSFSQEGPVKSWRDSTAALRNRVVHGGYRPTKHEAQASLTAIIDLERFVCDRLAESRSKYPRTALSMLGRAGLDRRKVWSDHLFSEKNIGPITQFTQDFVTWRDAILQEIEKLRT